MQQIVTRLTKNANGYHKQCDEYGNSVHGDLDIIHNDLNVSTANSIIKYANCTSEAEHEHNI